MSESIRLSRAELAYYANAKAHTREVPGYYKPDGTLVRGIFYEAKLGTKTVGYPEVGSYIADAGMYQLRSDALQGAKLFREKMREKLAAGDYPQEAQ